TGEPYMATEDAVDLEVDGKLQRFYYSFSYRPLRDSSGKIYAIWNSAMDVTELVQSRIKAQNTEQEYRDLAEAMPHIVWTTDLENKLVYYNKNLINFLNLKEDEIDSFDFSAVIHPEDLIKFKDVWEKSTMEHKFFEMELRLYSPEKNDFVWFLNRATPVLDENGNLRQWIGTSTNI